MSDLGSVFAQYATPQVSADYLRNIAQIESSGDPTRDNASGAQGLFQFMPGTWASYGQGDPHDPAAATQGAVALTTADAAALARSLGRAPTEGELYLAHQQGAGGASNLLSHPNARAGDLVGDRAVTGNGGRADMSARDFSNLWTSKYASVAGQAGSLPTFAQHAAAPGPDQGTGGTGLALNAAPRPDTTLGDALFAASQDPTGGIGGTGQQLQAAPAPSKALFATGGPKNPNLLAGVRGPVALGAQNG